MLIDPEAGHIPNTYYLSTKSTSLHDMDYLPECRLSASLTLTQGTAVKHKAKYGRDEAHKSRKISQALERFPVPKQLLHETARTEN